MLGSVRSLLGHAVVPAAIATAAALPLALPSHAQAYWRGGVWIGIPPVVVAPPAYYVPPPTYYAPPVYAYRYPYYPRRVWVPGHWRGGYWIPGHWS